MSMALPWSSWYAGVVRGRDRRDAVTTMQQCRGGGVVEQGRRASRRFRHLLGRSSRRGGRVGTTLSWRACLCSPHLLYIVPARQGSTTQLGWAPPTREPSQGPDSVIGPSRWRSMLTGSWSLVHHTQGMGEAGTFKAHELMYPTKSCY